MKIDTAFILCAGFGKRVKPLTDKVPKPLLNIKNQTLLDRCLNLVEDLGIEKVYLNVFHLKEEIKNYVKKKEYQSDVLIVEDGEKILDTGGGILNILQSSNSDNFLILNPDTLWTPNYKDEIKQMEKMYFEKKLSNILLLAKKELSFDKNLSGDFNLNKNLITRDIENGYIFTGCQILNNDLFKGFNIQPFSVSTIWNELIKKKNLNGFESKNKFYHVTNLEIFKKLQDL